MWCVLKQSYKSSFSTRIMTSLSQTFWTGSLTGTCHFNCQSGCIKTSILFVQVTSLLI